MIPLPSSAFKIYNKIYHSKKLEKLAKQAEGQERTDLLKKKAEVDVELLQRIKQAAFDGRSMLNAAKSFGGTAAKGLAAGAGATIPLAATGSYLSDKFTEDARNRALQTGVGLAGLGAGLYGIHRATQPDPNAPRASLSLNSAMDPRTGRPISSSNINMEMDPEMLQQLMLKQGHVNDPVQKLAAIGVLDIQLDSMSGESVPALKNLNNQNLIDTLFEIIS